MRRFIAAVVGLGLDALEWTFGRLFSQDKPPIAGSAQMPVPPQMDPHLTLPWKCCACDSQGEVVLDYLTYVPNWRAGSVLAECKDCNAVNKLYFCKDGQITSVKLLAP